MIGRIAKPDKIQFVSGLPKTRSGTFGMRRILRKVAENELGSLGDTSTLLDRAVVPLRPSIASRSAEHCFGIARDDRRTRRVGCSAYRASRLGKEPCVEPVVPLPHPFPSTFHPLCRWRQSQSTITP
jgi:hypothetical protein